MVKLSEFHRKRNQKGKNNPNWKGGITKIKKKCPICGKKFNGYMKKYCSKKCYYKSFEKKGAKIKVRCLNCGKEFLKWKCQIKRYPRNFCSRKCAWTSKKRMEHLKKRVERECDYCHKKIEVKQYKIKIKQKHFFCSKICHYNWQREFWKPSSISIFKMIKTREKNLLMAFIKGIHHKTHSYTYRKIMLEFLEMKRCQICGSNKNLIVHHIDGNRANNKISKFGCFMSKLSSQNS